MSNFEMRSLALTMAVEHSETGAPVETVLDTAARFHDYLSGAPIRNAARAPARSYTTIQIMELMICQNDPVKFAESIALPAPDGTLTGRLNEQQLEYISDLHTNANTVCLASRQIGASLCLAIFVLWTAMYKANQTVAVLAPTHNQSIEIIHRVRVIYENLPDHLKLPVTGNSKEKVTFENDSAIITRALTSYALRGLGVTLLAIDNACWISHSKSDEAKTLIAPHMTLGTKAIIQSSAGEAQGFFYDLWAASLPKDARTGFTPVFLDWRDCPGRDATWAADMKRNIGEQAFRRDYDGEFTKPRAPSPK